MNSSTRFDRSRPGAPPAIKGIDEKSTTVVLPRVASLDLSLGGLAQTALAGTHPAVQPDRVPPQLRELLAELSSLGMDSDTISAAVAADAVDAALNDLRMRKDAQLIARNLQLLQSIRGGIKRADTDYYPDAVLSMTDDVRALIILLVSHVVRMRLASKSTASTRRRLARGALSLYIPLTQRVGMAVYTRELEDLALLTVNSERYEELQRAKLTAIDAERDVLARLTRRAAGAISAMPGDSAVHLMLRSLYGVYVDSLDSHNDSSSFRHVEMEILVPSIEACYHALDALFVEWECVPGTFRDHIVRPRSYFDRSLEADVLVSGQALRVVIRTQAMRASAELGILLPWSMLPVPEDWVQSSAADSDLDWSWGFEDLGEAWANLRKKLHAPSVFCLTPDRDIVPLPRGATAIDFAYRIHTEVGHRAAYARIDGADAPLTAPLETGETVEIVRSEDDAAAPKPEWLHAARSPLARRAIQGGLDMKAHIHSIVSGREQLREALERQGVDLVEALAEQMLSTAATHFKADGLDSLFLAISEGDLSAGEVSSFVLREIERNDARRSRGLQERRWDHVGLSDSIDMGSIEATYILVARCCLPYPGDEIVGFLTRGRGISVHRTDCPNVEDLRRQPRRLIPVKWKDLPEGRFRVGIRAQADPRDFLLADILRVLAEMGVETISASASRPSPRVRLSLTCELLDFVELESIITSINAVNGVDQAHRWVPRDYDELISDAEP